VNGEYPGADGNVHEIKKGHLMYTNFSGWDIYRSEAQFLAMIAPGRASDMAQSLLLDYQQGGTFPRWPVPNMDSGVMMGDPAAPIIADFYAFGARNFDVKDAFDGLMRAATDTTVYAPLAHTYERDALGDYLKLGYVPEHQKGGYGNVSMTLEYNSADFALSRMAESLGRKSDASLLLKHAQNWMNLYNPESGYMQMKRVAGTWAPGFSDTVLTYDHDQAYVEGTASQYVWMVPFNLKGLAEKMGGLKVAAARLDTFFTKLNDGTRSRYAYLGNEPCLETPWEFDFFGEPYRTQDVVRRAMTQLFSYKPDGYPGNDDLGEMSSWYIFGALGMYPELPGSDVLVLGSPLFPKAILHLPHGDVTIIGRGARADAPYVHAITVNGKSWTKPWMTYSDIEHGGTLVYKLSSTPDKTWGSASSEAPPSYH
jgi:predicted alpha-1,2-mannosidase